MARTSRKQTAVQTAAAEVKTEVWSAALYVRLSVLDSGKKDGDSILNQQEMLERYVAERPELALKRVFVDNGETGVDFHRPAWSDLMRECQSGRITCIVLKDLSRLGRTYIETGELLETILPGLGVRVIAINDRYDNLNLTNGERMVANLKNLVNDLYAKDISRKSSAALRMKQKQGAFIGTYASYGYLKDPNDKNKIIVDPETAPIVRQIYEWKASGLGNAPICRKLIDMNVSSPNKYRFEKGIVKDDRYIKSEWSTAVIISIIENEICLGHMVQGRQRGALYEDGGTHKRVAESEWTIVRNTHEPIVSQDLFDRANAVLRERSAAFKEHQGKYTHFEKPPLLLQNLVFCADCGKPLYRYKSVTSHGKYCDWIYKCRTHDNLMTCPAKYVHEKDLYNAVFEAIRLEIQKCCDITGIIAKLNRESDHKSRLVRFDADIEGTERELKRLSLLKQAVYEDYAAKLLTVSEYQFATEKYNADTDKQQARLESAKREKMEYTQSSTPTNKWLAAFTRFTGAKEFTAEMAQALIERVEVSERNKVHITFKFRDEYAAIQNYAEET
jgi:DNA invertase Pin-like site-specific DNA recombinase